MYSWFVWCMSCSNKISQTIISGENAISVSLTVLHSNNVPRGRKCARTQIASNSRPPLEARRRRTTRRKIGRDTANSRTHFYTHSTKKIAAAGQVASALTAPLSVFVAFRVRATIQLISIKINPSQSQQEFEGGGAIQSSTIHFYIVRFLSIYLSICSRSPAPPCPCSFWAQPSLPRRRRAWRWRRARWARSTPWARCPRASSSSGSGWRRGWWCWGAPPAGTDTRRGRRRRRSRAAPRSSRSTPPPQSWRTGCGADTSPAPAVCAWRGLSGRSVSPENTQHPKFSKNVTKWYFFIQHLRTKVNYRRIKNFLNWFFSILFN